MENLVTKTDLINIMCSNNVTLSSTEAKVALDTVLTAIKQSLAEGKKVQLTGFGTFKVSPRAAHNGRNPQTGEPMVIPACNQPTFSAGSDLKATVNKK